MMARLWAKEPPARDPAHTRPSESTVRTGSLHLLETTADSRQARTADNRSSQERGGSALTKDPTGDRCLTLTYDFTDHEDEADGRSDEELLLGDPLVPPVLSHHSSRTVAVGADRSLQLDGAGNASVF